MHPTVSIITPTYQHGRYIRECLSSVVAQTFSDWELIVVDDGSPDDTVAQARSVSDPRIRILPRAHVGLDGLAETFNAGLAECRGSFVGVIEGDDRWLRQKLEQQVAIMRDAEVVLTYGRYSVIGTGGRVLSTPPLGGPVRRGRYDAFGAMLLDSFVMLVSTLMRRDTLLRLGGFKQLPRHAHPDYATFLALAEEGPFYANDHVVAHWRRHTGSATVRATTAPEFYEGARICERHALEVRRSHAGQRDLPSESKISVAWSGVLARRYWHAGRVLQTQRQWTQARRLFLTGLGCRGASLRQRALLLAGGVTAALHVDLERIVALLRGGSPLSDL